MTEEIKKMVDLVIYKKGVDDSIRMMEDMIKDSYKIKDSLLEKGIELCNIISHIEVGLECLEYIKNKLK